MSIIDYQHIPVLRQEVLDCLLPADLKLPESEPLLFVDATLGGGGHASALMMEFIRRFGQEAFEAKFRLLGIDQDQGILDESKARLLSMDSRFRGNDSLALSENDTLGTEIYQSAKHDLSGKYDLRAQLTFVHGSFSDLSRHLQEAGYTQISGGLLADIGVSSFQLDQAERGFSFNKEAPLDMRMDRSQTLTAQEVVNTYSEQALAKIFGEYGEERFSKTVARLIVERRKTALFSTTIDLSRMIEQLYRQKLGSKPFRIHPATKVFQALRIEVNQELSRLESLIRQLPDCLAPGARAAIISFHSLEDRIVKHAFRALYQNNGPLELITRKPVGATDEEIVQNPRSRSAKLRCVERR